MRLKAWMWPLATIAVALAALAVSLLVIDRWGEAAIARQQAAIAAAARDYFVAFAREEGVAPLIATLDRRERVGAPDGFRYALLDADGRLLAGADVVGSLNAPDAGWRTVAEPASSPRRFWRVLAQPLDGGLTLVVAEALSARDALRGAILQGSAIALTLTAVGAAIAGAGLHALMLSRTRGIARTAERIAGGDLSARAPERPGGDVFDDLAGSVNAMLTRIEELMTGMRTVTDSLAHDLRSPLTRLKGALARAAADETAPDDRAAAIDQAHREVDGALATLSALLDIARAESGLSRDMLQRVDAARLALEMGELFAPVLEDAGQGLRIDVPATPVIACLHETLLRQALGNLLHNAAIHAGPGARVVLSVEETEAGEVRIVVADTGPGVPADQLGRVQERFVRLEAARTRPGSGLGLALVAACAKLHCGRLVLEDNSPGLRAVLEAPLRG
ncbi:MAG: sensor histidine kinase [Phenylobacterium sp.]|uniref:sensor histidine kinase n=1 Tax=Phenylobacterium sp. TaxID=1871053 RepID=UPI00391BDFC3